MATCDQTNCCALIQFHLSSGRSTDIAVSQLFADEDKSCFSLSKNTTRKGLVFCAITAALMGGRARQVQLFSVLQTNGFNKTLESLANKCINLLIIDIYYTVVLTARFASDKNINY